MAKAPAKKITKLTPEQVARFGEWSEKWIKIGLSTEPADFDKATEAALRAYQLANLKRPLVILRMSSPYGATLGGAIAWAMLREIADKKVWSQVESQVRSQVWSAYYNLYHGSLYASWGAYVSFLRDVCGWQDPVLERFEVDEALIKSCGWVWWHENVLAISDRPSVINRDAENRLHCESGPSITCRDGWELYHWHGVSVPLEWIVERHKLTPEIALKQENAEQRRAACEILGWDHILAKLNAQVIDADADPEIGTLLRVDLPDAPAEQFLRVQCGTGRMFALPVPPDMPTAIAAQSWLWGVNAESFTKPEVRT